MKTIGMRLTIPEANYVTSILDEEDIHYDIWNCEEVFFDDPSYAEIEVKEENFDYFKTLVDSYRESSL